MPFKFRQLIFVTSATVMAGLAVALLVSTGLPQRQTFTGELVSGNWVAPEINALAPPINEETLAGDTLNLQNLRGQPVIINFWATWCAPCRVEMPILQSLFDQYHAQGLQIVAVNMGENRLTATRWIEDFNYTFDVVLDQQQRLIEQYQVRGQPSTYIVTPDGRISHIIYGPVSENSLRNAIQPYLGE